MESNHNDGPTAHKNIINAPGPSSSWAIGLLYELICVIKCYILFNLFSLIQEYLFNECLFYHMLYTDQDECAVDIDACDQNCNGSFFCSCNNGYRLSVDGKTCDG